MAKRISPFKGKHHTQEAKEKNRIAHLGKTHFVSIETRRKISLSRIGDKHPLWKADGVSYGALHSWVKRHLIKPQVCRDCNQPKPLDLANISQEYKRDLSDWEWLCRSCHMTKDGRLEKLIDNRPILKGENSPRWKGGVPKCLDCGALTNNGTYSSKRCRPCYLKLKVRGKRGKYVSHI